MTAYYADADIGLLVGDCREQMRSLPAGFARTCVTSPPYYGLRDYGVDGQIGLEDTPEAYVAGLVEVFREVRRCLADDGTLWLNLGDSYAMSTKGSSGKGDKQITNAGTLIEDRRWRIPEGLKAKDLIGIPWMVAFALRADGWWLRQEIIWHKPSPMPESVRDRCTKAHEQVFLLAKSERYYFDARAIAEPAVTAGDNRAARTDNAKRERSGGPRSASGKVQGETRNRRSVWAVTPRPFKGAHFATMPPDLVEPCVLAGSAVGDVVVDPFSGAGTTALVARSHGRKFVGTELNPEYAAISVARWAEGA